MPATPPIGADLAEETLELMNSVVGVYSDGSPGLPNASPSATAGNRDAGIPPDSVAAQLPPPPVLLAGPSAERKKRGRGAAGPSGELAIAVEGGIIQYFESNGNFQATCLVHLGERCTLTKKGFAAAKRFRGKIGGRPVPYLAAWLSVGPLCQEKHEHLARGI